MITKKDITKIDIKRYKKFIKEFDEQTIKISQLDREHDIQDNKNKEFYQPYFNIVKNTATLIKELHLTDPLDASKAFEYLLWQGYLSQNKTFEYNEDRINNILIPGTDIMLGKAVCLNNAEMLTRVLNELDINSYLIGAYYNFEKTKIKDTNNPTLKEKARVILEKINIFNKIYGNHAITLIKNCNDRYFLDDPTGEDVLNFTGFLEAQGILNDFNMKIIPWLLISDNDNISYEKVQEIVLNTYKYSDEKVITKDELKYSFYKVNTILRENKNLLNDFHDENKKDINIICKTLKKEKKY